MFLSVIRKIKKLCDKDFQIVRFRNSTTEYEYRVNSRDGVYFCRKREIGTQSWVFDSVNSSQEGYHQAMKNSDDKLQNRKTKAPLGVGFLLQKGKK